MRFKEGDYVKVRRWKDMICEFGIDDFGDIPCWYSFIAKMKCLCGQILSISVISSSDQFYKAQSSSEDISEYCFSDDMLELRTYSKEEFEQQENTR
jgi:hypothetical protein